MVQGCSLSLLSFCPTQIFFFTLRFFKAYSVPTAVSDHINKLNMGKSKNVRLFFFLFLKEVFKTVTVESLKVVSDPFKKYFSIPSQKGCLY